MIVISSTRNACEKNGIYSTSWAESTDRLFILYNNIILPILGGHTTWNIAYRHRREVYSFILRLAHSVCREPAQFCRIIHQRIDR